jgi:nucleotide-binding universal stress UspA family protein
VGQGGLRYSPVRHGFYGLRAQPRAVRAGTLDPVTSLGPEFELGTDGPSLILVGIDGSRTSMRAAAYAAGLARRQHSRLLAVYVTRPSASIGMAPAAAPALHEAAEQAASDLERQVREGAARLGLDAEFRTVCGDPWTEINRAAVESKADAVVVGASEHAGHRIVGSLAMRLVRAGKWPVTVVP